LVGGLEAEFAERGVDAFRYKPCRRGSASSQAA
jgi:hypothetical protein